MRAGITITVSSTDRRRLEAVVKDRNAAQKHVWQATIVLLTADDLRPFSPFRTASTIPGGSRLLRHNVGTNSTFSFSHPQVGRESPCELSLRGYSPTTSTGKG
jgi:hypothetical protein